MNDHVRYQAFLRILINLSRSTSFYEKQPYMKTTDAKVEKTRHSNNNVRAHHGLLAYSSVIQTPVMNTYTNERLGLASYRQQAYLN